jgi:hypothetical protein
LLIVADFLVLFTLKSARVSVFPVVAVFVAAMVAYAEFALYLQRRNTPVANRRAVDAREWRFVGLPSLSRPRSRVIESPTSWKIAVKVMTLALPESPAYRQTRQG